MKFLVASMDSGRTFAPDGEEFENMQVLGFVEASNIIEARHKFINDNSELLSHGYGSECNLKFYYYEDTATPEEDSNFFEYSLNKNELHFWGSTIGSYSAQLDDDTLFFLKNNGINENEVIEFSNESVQLLYRKVIYQHI